MCLAVLSSEARAESALPGVRVEKRDPNRNNRNYWRSDSDCLTHGRRYSHGEYFNLPGISHCLRYRCNRGRVENIEEACEVEGQCHRVGSYFDHHCVTYKCEKFDRGSHFFYQPTWFRTRCEDARGRCRRERETFSKYIRGQYYRNCQCIISSSGAVRYSCSNN
ncbi:hypothetical protein ElyMa_002993700 [Elysia marginata]|uniref:Uncharacterized protein n=1 Tax=Elysia marginata TaxID=1093978 RepID=A0AAV4ICK6_9GAST|nr:hypothetical protein ElyMa_002993700 [Elysia marginata]